MGNIIEILADAFLGNLEKTSRRCSNDSKHFNEAQRNTCSEISNTASELKQVVHNEFQRASNHSSNTGHSSTTQGAKNIRVQKKTVNYTSNIKISHQQFPEPNYNDFCDYHTTQIGEYQEMDPDDYNGPGYDDYNY